MIVGRSVAGVAATTGDAKMPSAGESRYKARLSTAAAVTAMVSSERSAPSRRAPAAAYRGRIAHQATRNSMPKATPIPAAAACWAMTPFRLNEIARTATANRHARPSLAGSGPRRESAPGTARHHPSAIWTY